MYEEYSSLKLSYKLHSNSVEQETDSLEEPRHNTLPDWKPYNLGDNLGNFTKQAINSERTRREKVFAQFLVSRLGFVVASDSKMGLNGAHSFLKEPGREEVTNDNTAIALNDFVNLFERGRGFEVSERCCFGHCDKGWWSCGVGKLNG